MSLASCLAAVLASPTAESLWNLRAALLAIPDPPTPEARDAATRGLEVVGRFRQYLGDLSNRAAAHGHSQTASQLDMGSVGLLAIQDLVSDRKELFKKLFLGGLSEALMVLATLQYVKAFETEARQVHEDAAWWLYEGFWQLSRDLRPDLTAPERRTLIEALLAPARAAGASGTTRTIVLVGLFQSLLAACLAPLVTGEVAAAPKAPPGPQEAETGRPKA